MVPSLQASRERRLPRLVIGGKCRRFFFGIFFHRNLLGHRIVLEFSSVWEGGEDVRLSRARVWESSA